MNLTRDPWNQSFKESISDSNINWALHSHKWPRHNFSLQYQYNVKQTSDENKKEKLTGPMTITGYQ